MLPPNKTPIAAYSRLFHKRPAIHAQFLEGRFGHALYDVSFMLTHIGFQNDIICAGGWLEKLPETEQYDALIALEKALVIVRGWPSSRDTLIHFVCLARDIVAENALAELGPRHLEALAFGGVS